MPLFRIRQPKLNTIAIGPRDYGDGEVVELNQHDAMQIRRSCGALALELVSSIGDAEKQIELEDQDVAHQREIEQSLRNPPRQRLVDVKSLDRAVVLSIAKAMGSPAATTLKGAQKFLSTKSREEITRTYEALQTQQAEADIA